MFYGIFDCLFMFFFKQKTAYEMRISDWSSDVCSSDLHDIDAHQHGIGRVADEGEPAVRQHDRVELVAMQHQQLAAVGGLMDRLAPYLDAAEAEAGEQIGRAHV